MSSQQLMASAAGSAGAKTSIELSGVSPFEIGKPVTVLLFSTGSGTAPQYDIETSEDDTTFEVAGSVTTVGLTAITVPAGKFMRVNVDTAAGTAGLVSAVLVSGL